MKDINPDRWRQIESVLDGALELDPELRRPFVDEACGDDEELRSQVMSMLGAGENAAGFLEGSKPEKLQEVLREMAAEAEAEENDPNVDRVMGPYRLIRRLGRGGMGQVYLGVRDDEAFKKYVAVKIIRRGMDTDEILQRFRTERRILASLTHPNIARLLDGGATEDGASYFVMDFVDGVTITKYCDEKRLPVRSRLELFQKVCRAVHYAHQNLIVHRDLKPSNILVTSEGAVKLLDFGIAKFLNPDEAGYTVPVTVTEMRVMTPEYASPEQVRGESITTASDVYQLGILLYELLTGCRPHRFSGERKAEIERIICEREPDRPSTAITRPVEDDGITAARDISGLRSTPVDRLRKQLTGDLDRIVLMALRKEADRRYQSADQFLEDIKRYLAGLPVQAQSDTWTYRTAKFVRRHRLGVAASTSLAFLVVVLSGMAFQFALVTSEQNEKIRIALEKKNQVTDLVLGMFEMSDPEFSRGREITAREILERGAERLDHELLDQPDVKAEMLNTIGTVYMQLGLFEEAEPSVRKALEMRRELYGGQDSEELAQSLYRMALWMEEMGNGEDAKLLHEEALGMRERLFEAPHRDIAASLNDFGVLMISYFGDLEEAELLFRSALEMRLALEGPESKAISETMSNLALVRNELEDYGEAESLYRRALAMQQSVLGEDHPYVASNLHNLGTLMFDLQSYDEAESMFRQAMSLRETLYGPRHNQVANSMNYLGRTLQMKGLLSQAEPLLRTSLENHEAEYGPSHPRVARDRQMLGRLLFERGNRPAGIRELERALGVFEQSLPPEHWLIEEAREDLARMQGE